jgi:flavin reductase (DIM6/NTAB) family NADH-FMN oxidoreductase RutF
MNNRPTFRKKDYPVSEIRRYLELGPVLLVSSASKGTTNIMTMGWHMMLEFSPALFGCCIANGNHSFEMARRSKECVINVRTTALLNEVIGIGNCSGADVDKFKEFRLTAVRLKVSAPLIKSAMQILNVAWPTQSDFEIRAVHLGGRQSSCGHLPKVSRDCALPGRGRLHDLWSFY